MHLRPLPFALLSLLVALQLSQLRAHYDDDETNPQRVRLEDLERDFGLRNTVPKLQSRPPTPTPAPPQPPTPHQQLPQYEPDATPTQLPPLAPAPLRRPIIFDEKRLLNYNTAPNYSNKHNVDNGERQVPTKFAHASGRQQLSAGYTLKKRPEVFVLLPPYNAHNSDANRVQHNNGINEESNEVNADDDDVDDDERGSSEEHGSIAAQRQRATATIYLPQRPLLHGDSVKAHSSGAATNSFVSFARNEHGPPPPLLPTTQLPLPLTLPTAAAPPPPPPLHSYLSDNQLSDAAGIDNPYRILSTYTYFVPTRPHAVYGPAAHTAPRYDQSIQSNQLGYAPPRRPDAGALSAGSVTLPYPPSFISITTSRPPAAALQDEDERDNYTNLYSNRNRYYSRQFRPSQQDPLPDIFATRQSKSLLDSYIPSWVIAQMQQQQRQQRYGFHTLAYPVSAYERAPMIKRDLRSVKAGKVVKKALDAQQSDIAEAAATTGQEQMLMTE